MSIGGKGKGTFLVGLAHFWLNANGCTEMRWVQNKETEEGYIYTQIKNKNDSIKFCI